MRGRIKDADAELVSRFGGRLLFDQHDVARVVARLPLELYPGDDVARLDVSQAFDRLPSSRHLSPVRCKGLIKIFCQWPLVPGRDLPQMVGRRLSEQGDDEPRTI